MPQALEYWEASRRGTLDSAEFMQTLTTDKDLQQLIGVRSNAFEMTWEGVERTSYRIWLTHSAVLGCSRIVLHLVVCFVMLRLFMSRNHLPVFARGGGRESTFQVLRAVLVGHA